MCQIYTRLAPHSGPVKDSAIRTCVCHSVCVSVCVLTCPGILCRHTDAVQNTWRQCHGKGCLELWASWAEERGGK